MRCNDSAVQPLRFYLTASYDCSYLPARLARSQVAAYAPQTAIGDYDRLIRLGFRRSGDFIYRPHCPTCEACQSLRIPVERFRPDRSQRRTLKRHAQVRARWLRPAFVPSHFALYQRYQNARHPGGSMDGATPEEYTEYLLNTPVDTWLVEFQSPGAPNAEDEVVMVSVIDRMADGLSAVYTFFDPDPRASWGTYNVLWQIEQARQLGLPYVYLGYWIAGCPKMAYKTRFQPCERLVHGQWLSGDHV